MLNRNYFVLFSGGFSLCMILKQLGLVIAMPSQRRLGYLLLVWSTYLMIQLVNTWSSLQVRPLTGITWAVSTSTLFYSGCVTWLLYISMQRYLAINHQNSFALYVRWGTIGLMIVVFIIRFIRTILVYIQNSGSSVFPAAAVMQVITIFPIFVIRMIFDIASLVKLFQHFSSVTNQPANKLVAFYQLGYSLVVEVILTFFSIVVAVLESQNYTGDDVADMDWIMISWAIGALLEQSQILTKLFHDDGKVSGTKTNTAKKTIENTGKASSTDL